MPFQTPWALPDGKPRAGKNFPIHRNGKTAPRVFQDSGVPIFEADLLKIRMEAGCPHPAEGGWEFEDFSSRFEEREEAHRTGIWELRVTRPAIQRLDNGGGLVALV